MTLRPPIRTTNAGKRVDSADSEHRHLRGIRARIVFGRDARWTGECADARDVLTTEDKITLMEYLSVFRTCSWSERTFRLFSTRLVPCYEPVPERCVCVCTALIIGSDAYYRV